MPAYNAAKYLREAIDSILAQTYTDFEFIIINDGSTDDTRAIIQSYDDPRIVYLENETNSGICVTLNKGLDSARGRYIARMDADDISLPERLAVQVAFMDAHPEVGVAGCCVERFSDDLSIQEFPPSESDYYRCKSDLLFSTCLAHPTAIIRKTVVDDHNLRYEDFFRGMEDYKLWWEISKYVYITNIPSVLLKYRIHKGQVTQAPLTEDFVNRIKIFISQRLNDLGLDPCDEDIQAILRYEINPSSFDDETFKHLIISLKKVLKSLKNNRNYYTEQKEVSGKAISYAYDLSSANMTKTNLYYMLQAYRLSCMPFIWLMKRIYHILF